MENDKSPTNEDKGSSRTNKPSHSKPTKIKKISYAKIGKADLFVTGKKNSLIERLYVIGTSPALSKGLFQSLRSHVGIVNEQTGVAASLAGTLNINTATANAIAQSIQNAIEIGRSINQPTEVILNFLPDSESVNITTGTPNPETFQMLKIGTSINAWGAADAFDEQIKRIAPNTVSSEHSRASDYTQKSHNYFSLSDELRETFFKNTAQLNLDEGTIEISEDLRKMRAENRALLNITKEAHKLLRSLNEQILELKGTYAWFEELLEPSTSKQSASSRNSVLADSDTVVAVPSQDYANIESTTSSDATLNKARLRGTVLASKILQDEDMMNSDEFAKEIGLTRVTVNEKQIRGELLALEGAKRGKRYPKWQIGLNGSPYPIISELLEIFGNNSWSVYRFLKQHHPELDEKTGLQAMRDGDDDALRNAATNTIKIDG